MLPVSYGPMAYSLPPTHCPLPIGFCLFCTLPIPLDDLVDVAIPLLLHVAQVLNTMRTDRRPPAARPRRSACMTLYVSVFVPQTSFS